MLRYWMGDRLHGRHRSAAHGVNPISRRVLRPLALLGAAIVLALAGCTVGGGGSSSTGPGTSIPLQILKGQNNATLAVAPVTINGHGPYPFIVDTGASISLISRSLAQQLGLPRTSGRLPVSGVGGTEQVVFVDVKNWKVGKVALPNTSVGSGALPSSGSGGGGSNLQGLLGSDLWSQFGTITLDYSAAKLTIYKSVTQRSGGSSVALQGGELVLWRQAA